MYQQCDIVDETLRAFSRNIFEESLLTKWSLQVGYLLVADSLHSIFVATFLYQSLVVHFSEQTYSHHQKSQPYCDTPLLADLAHLNRMTWGQCSIVFQSNIIFIHVTCYSLRYRSRINGQLPDENQLRLHVAELFMSFRELLAALCSSSTLTESLSSTR